MNNRFVLFTARHSSPEIEGLPSVFNETTDVWNLVYSPEFTDFVTQDMEDPIIIYVTGLTMGTIQVMRDFYWRCVFMCYDRDSDSYREF